MKIRPANEWHEELGDSLFIRFARDEDGEILGESPEVEFASGYIQDGFNIDEWDYFLDKSINTWFDQAQRIEGRKKKIKMRDDDAKRRKIRNITIFKRYVEGEKVSALGAEYHLRPDYITQQLIRTAARTAIDACGLKIKEVPSCIRNPDYRVNKEAYLHIANSALEFIKCEK